MIKNLKINDGKATALISLSPSGMQPYDITIFIDDESGDIQRESQIHPILDRIESFFKQINIDDLIWAFSDKFKELVVSNNLKMEFLPLTWNTL